MKGHLSLKFESGQSLEITLEDCLVLALGPMATTQIAFNKNKKGQWALVLNHSLIPPGEKLAPEFLTAKKS